MKKPVNLRGVGEDAPTVTNAAGGKQSESPYRFDLLPPLALAEVAAILKHGADKYGDDNWYSLSPEECSTHVLQHAFAFLAGDTTEGGDPIHHLRRVACRALMWLELEERRRREQAEEVGVGHHFKIGDTVRVQNFQSKFSGRSGQVTAVRPGYINVKFPDEPCCHYAFRTMELAPTLAPMQIHQSVTLPKGWTGHVAPLIPQAPAEDTELNKG